MDHHDILFVIYDILSDREDAESLLNCSLVNKLMNRTFNEYDKYRRLPSVKICKLSNSPMGPFKDELLSLLLVDTKISPMIGETWSMVKYLRTADNTITMGSCLDRLIPDNTPSGNDMDYKPGELLQELIIRIIAWLCKWSKFDLNQKTLVPDENAVEASVETWYELESALDEFYRLLFKYVSSRMTVREKNDWEVTYDNYSLYSTQNIANTKKTTLYLNKLKTIYQMSN